MTATHRWIRGASVALALTTLAACKSGKKSPPVSGQSSLADSAGQVMFGARFNLTDGGVLRAQLVADTAFFFDDNTRVELTHPNTTFFTTTGQKNAVLTARRGTYHTNTGQMLARGDVDVTTTDGRRLRSEQLAYDQNRNEISSDSAFVLTEPSRRLEGVGFRSDPQLQNVHILKTLSGSSGAIVIPNQ
ncbi:MAG TPA: LPS export ABC transporter periplasmic protein LptC [Candidatus Elarobacter sp.]|nr:LPS export ABC transporter periplasmic protein LptC [Candidatus Elarobacter sp.]